MQGKSFFSPPYYIWCDSRLSIWSIDVSGCRKLYTHPIRALPLDVAFDGTHIVRLYKGSLVITDIKRQTMREFFVDFFPYAGRVKMAILSGTIVAVDATGVHYFDLNGRYIKTIPRRVMVDTNFAPVVVDNQKACFRAQDVETGKEIMCIVDGREVKEVDGRSIASVQPLLIFQRSRSGGTLIDEAGNPVFVCSSSNPIAGIFMGDVVSVAQHWIQSRPVSIQTSSVITIWPPDCSHPLWIGVGEEVLNVWGEGTTVYVLQGNWYYPHKAVSVWDAKTGSCSVYRLSGHKIQRARALERANNLLAETCKLVKSGKIRVYSSDSLAWLGYLAATEENNLEWAKTSASYPLPELPSINRLAS